MNLLTREWLFWASAAACVVAEAAIILSSLRSLRRANGKNAISETLWAVLPAIVLVWLFTATWKEVQRSGAHEQMTMPMPASNS